MGEGVLRIIQDGPRLGAVNMQRDEELLARSGLYRTLYELQFRSAADHRGEIPAGEPWKTN